MGNGGNIRIDLDPMISYFWLDTLAGEIKHDQVGFLPGHVAVDAVVGDRMIGFAEDGRVRFVAGQAPLGKYCEIVLWLT